MFKVVSWKCHSNSVSIDLYINIYIYIHSNLILFFEVGFNMFFARKQVSK